MEINNEDILALLSRLDEWLHQTDVSNLRSHLELVYVASGAQYVNKIGTQIFGTDKSKKSVPDASLSAEPPQLSGPLATQEAQELWQKAQNAGYVNEKFQPKLSRTKAALLAYAMASKLGIRNKWRVFETLWCRQNMYQDYYDAVNQQQSLDFQDDLKALFG